MTEVQMIETDLHSKLDDALIAFKNIECNLVNENYDNVLNDSLKIESLLTTICSYFHKRIKFVDTTDDIMVKLQTYFENKFGVGSCSVGYGDQKFYVYKHKKRFIESRPQWLSKEYELVFEYVGKLRPA